MITSCRRLAEIARRWSGQSGAAAAADALVSGSRPADVATPEAAVATGACPCRRDRGDGCCSVTSRTDGHSRWPSAANALIAGDAKSGKSWLGLFCEQLILQGYSVRVIDPEGDYRSLEALPGVTVLGGEDPPPSPRELLTALRYPDQSVVIDLTRQRYQERSPTCAPCCKR